MGRLGDADNRDQVARRAAEENKAERDFMWAFLLLLKPGFLMIAVLAKRCSAGAIISLFNSNSCCFVCFRTLFLHESSVGNFHMCEITAMKLCKELLYLKHFSQKTTTFESESSHGLVSISSADVAAYDNIYCAFKIKEKTIQ